MAKTLLGADDKAGIAEIMTAMAQLAASDTPHGAIRVAFTPDEEIGRGTSHFDVEGFAADWAYTIDGSDLGSSSMRTSTLLRPPSKSSVTTCTLAPPKG